MMNELDVIVCETLDVLHAETCSHPIVRHPFLEMMREGRLHRDAFADWMLQQSHFSRQFPRCLAALFARIDDFHVGRPLIRFIATEAWGSQEHGAHWQLYLEAVARLGLTEDDVRSTAMSPETQQFLNYRLGLCMRGPLVEAAAVFAFAHELVNEQIFEAYGEGYGSVVGARWPRDYFAAHVEDEPEDYVILRGVTAKLATSKKAIAAARKRVLEALDIRSRFFDACCRRYGGRGLGKGARAA